MRSNFLKYTWRSSADYCYGYTLITNHASIDDIINSGKKVVLWGQGRVQDVIAVRYVLEEKGIKIDYACDINYPFDVDERGHWPDVRNFRELLKPDKYFHIIAYKDAWHLWNAQNLLLFSGYDDFGIVYFSDTKDFFGRRKLQNAFFDTVNEIFEPFDFVYHRSSIDNLRHAVLTGAGYWDVPYRIIYDLYKKDFGLKKAARGGARPRYLEIGPGYGTMSLSLKKLLDIDVTWVMIPNEEALWSEVKRDSTRKLMEKYDIHTVEGFIEQEEFPQLKEYDVIVLAQVMEHFIYNPVNTLRRLANMLAPNGYLFASFPEKFAYPCYVTNYHEMPSPEELTAEERERRTLINDFRHFHEYTYDEAMEVFHESGLECVYHKWTDPDHHFMLRRADAPGAVDQVIDSLELA